MSKIAAGARLYAGPRRMTRSLAARQRAANAGVGGEGSRKECLAVPAGRNEARRWWEAGGRALNAINSNTEGAGEEAKKDEIKQTRCD